MTKKPLIYLGGDIMTFSSQLGRQYEYDRINEMDLPVDIYSPILNKSINDKSNMTEEENNHLAEKIVEADAERLWNSDCVVMCPEQSALGSICETGILYGWKYMAERLMHIAVQDDDDTEKLYKIVHELRRIQKQKDYFHYYDIRTNHLNEKDWRRSFSINQFLYGIILYASENNVGIETFEEIIEHLKEKYKDDTDGEK